MGDPKKTKKHYETPKKPYDLERLESERELVKIYGLKNKRELWRIETTLRKKRENARKLLALPLEARVKRENELLASLVRLGLLSDNSTLDDVLTLSIESLLERKLQTMVLRQGLANNIKQARQFIVHGHIAVNGKKVAAPSYLIRVDEEKKIAYYGKKMELKPKEVESKKDTDRNTKNGKKEAKETSSEKAREKKEADPEEKKEEKNGKKQKENKGPGSEGKEKKIKDAEKNKKEEVKSND